MGPISNYDIVVFDMEDALIDQGISLGTAISMAADAYLTSFVGVRPDGGPLYPTEEVKAFAAANGFEPDADLLHVLLVQALGSLSADLAEDDFDGMEGRDLMAALRQGGKVTESLGDLVRRKNLSEVGRQIRSKGGGKRGFQRLRAGRNRWLALAEGHIMMDNFVRRFLAESYLGTEMFTQVHGQPPQFVIGEGAIGLETSWIDLSGLNAIRKRCPMAAVTRRTQAEAQYVLRKLEMHGLLDVVVGLGAMGMGMATEDESSWIRTLGVTDNADAEYSTKVAEAIERVRIQEGIETMMRVAYVGSALPENRGISMLKERYRVTVIGTAFGQDRKLVPTQREHGADHAVADPGELLRVLSERPRPRSGSEYR
jgi:phosphoglycolate phosphatase-like HAD superfamily hydrolase